MKLNGQRMCVFLTFGLVVSSALRDLELTTPVPAIRFLRLRSSRAQVRQRVADSGAVGDWESHLGLNSSVRTPGDAVLVTLNW
jgi:hypothetical protein